MKALVWLAAATLAAQEPRFGAQSRLVILPVTVTDAKGRAVAGLQPEDFIVLDNGRPQKVTVDTPDTGVAPIALAVAVQASGISNAALEKIRKVGVMMLPLVAGGRGCVAIVVFSDRVRWIQDCTTEEDRVAAAFERIRPGAERAARMLDAVEECIVRLRGRQNARRVLLLISESRDRGSETSLEQVVMDAQAAGVTVYAATYSAFMTAWTTRSSATAEPQPPMRPPKPSDETGTVYGAPSTVKLPPPEQRVDILGGIGELARLAKTNTTAALAQATGGAAYSFTRLKTLEQTIDKLSRELHSQYVLSFTPDDATPGRHRLEVRVGRGQFRVRVRPAYWSVQSAR
jgi:VWFA-related protein